MSSINSIYATAQDSVEYIRNCLIAQGMPNSHKDVPVDTDIESVPPKRRGRTTKAKAALEEAPTDIRDEGNWKKCSDILDEMHSNYVQMDVVSRFSKQTVREEYTTLAFYLDYFNREEPFKEIADQTPYFGLNVKARFTHVIAPLVRIHTATLVTAGQQRSALLVFSAFLETLITKHGGDTLEWLMISKDFGRVVFHLADHEHSRSPSSFFLGAHVRLSDGKSDNVEVAEKALSGRGFTPSEHFCAVMNGILLGENLSENVTLAIMYKTYNLIAEYVFRIRDGGGDILTLTVDEIQNLVLMSIFNQCIATAAEGDTVVYGNIPRDSFYNAAVILHSIVPEHLRPKTDFRSLMEMIAPTKA